MHRLGDVLEPGLAKIADGKLEPRSHLPVGVLRKTYGSRLGNALQARRDVDAVTHQVAIAFLDDVAEMNADAKFDAPLRRQTGVALDHQVLNLDAATNSVDDTAKFHKNSIAGSLHDASVVDGDCRIDQVASQGTQPCQRAVLVRSGQPAESDDVRREDRSKLSRLSHVRASGLATQYLRTRSTEPHFSRQAANRGCVSWSPLLRLAMQDQAFAGERRSHSSRPIRPRRASPNGTSERSSTRLP